MSETCRICDGPARPSRLLAPLSFLACDGCGLAFEHRQSSAVVHEMYENGGYDATRGALYADPRVLRERRRHAQVRLAFIARHAAAGGRLLDVGAAAGAFVEQARAAGYPAEGIEPTPAFAAFARERLRVPVRTGTVEEVDLPEGAFDVVTMWHVLEHVPDPLAVLRRLQRAAAPNAVLAIEVPNAGGHLARAQGSDWPMLQPDVHVNQFTPRSLQLALERSGFDVVEISTVTIGPYLTRRERVAPGQIVHRLRTLQKVRTLSPHPHGHELLRAIGRRAADSAGTGSRSVPGANGQPSASARS